jgi:hypothetical protein
VTGPDAYDEIDQMPLTDVLNRHQVLSDRDSMARSIAAQQARGTWKADGSIRAEDYPPLTVAEHLELIALGERLARYYRHPALVHHAVTAGASWQQIADATGGNAGEALSGYLQWVEGQHKLREWYPDGSIGMGDDEYDAAVKAAAAADQGGHDVPQHDPAAQLAEIRAILARFDWEHHDRQLALEAIERIAEGGQA